MTEIENLDEEFNNSYTSSTNYASENHSLNQSIPLKDMSEENDNEKRADLLMINKETIYGNDIKIKKPYKLGKTFTCLYIKNQPLIAIGPHCTYKYINI
jgi:hypothetical protein